MDSLLRTAAVLLTILGCRDQGPPGNEPTRFSATLDRAPWVPDTAGAILFGSQCDTTLVVSATRQVTPEDSEEITLVLYQFRGATSVSLRDTATAAYGSFSLTHWPEGQLPTTQSYFTWSDHPGTLTIQGATRSDSVVFGSFAFEGAQSPADLTQRRVTGQFRVHYLFQQVYVVECDPPRNTR